MSSDDSMKVTLTGFVTPSLIETDEDWYPIFHLRDNLHGNLVFQWG